VAGGSRVCLVRAEIQFTALGACALRGGRAYREAVVGLQTVLLRRNAVHVSTVSAVTAVADGR